MQIDTAGTYLLKYTAEDECGNVTEVTREVVAEVISYRTVLYTDGTFIINEKSTDQAANEALHGVATNVYAPYNPNGSTNIEKYYFTARNQRPWYAQRSSILSVEIGSRIAPEHTAYWFDYLGNCTSFNLSLLDASETIDMAWMFSNCTSLTSISLSGLDTSKVETMDHLFNGCRALESIDLSGFDTSAVTNMSYMFYRCQALTSLDISDFDTSAVTDMSYMFSDCNALSGLDITHFDTSNVISMLSMFYACYAWLDLDVTHFDTSNVTNMQGMFSGCARITSIDVSSFDTSNVTNMTSMFSSCYAATTIYASPSFVVSQVTSSSGMFSNNLTNLVGGAGTVWSSSNANDATYARIDGGTSNPGYFTARSA